MKLYDLLKSLEPVDSTEEVEKIMNFLNENGIVFSVRRRDLILSYIHDKDIQDYFLINYGESAVEKEKPTYPVFNKKKLTTIQKEKKKRNKNKRSRGSKKTSVFDLLSKSSRIISVPFGGMNKRH